MDKIDIGKTLSQLSLRQKLGQMFLTNFVGTNEIPEQIKDLNRKGLLGGIIYFSGSNVEDAEQLRSLGAKIQALVNENPNGIPYFITLDQEGGQLSALHRGVSVFPGNMALGAADRPEMTRDYARITGQVLSYCGVNINFAPVLDVAYEARNGIHQVDNRMISSDCEVVSRHGVELVKGLQEGGVMACAKHYPGMKISEVDTHHQADIIDYGPETMEKYYFPPFKAAIDAGVAAIMTHHGIYPAYENRPATLSPVLISYLREELGFKGLVITDDLVMKAVQDAYPGPIACELAIKAGVDQIIITGGGEWLIDELVKSVEAGRISEEQIDQALERILRAKNEFIIGRVQAKELPDRDYSDELAIQISEAAIKLHKDEGVLPLNIGPDQRLSVALANPARLVMSDTVNFYDISLKAAIEKAGHHPKVKEVIVPWNPTPEEELSIFDIGFISDVLIFTSVNAYRFQGQLSILKKIHGLRAAGGQTPIIIAVASRSPDDVELLKPYADAVLSTSGLSELQIEALVSRIFSPVREGQGRQEIPAGAQK